MQKEPTAREPRCLATTVNVAPHSRPQPLPALQQPWLPAAGALSLTNQKAVAAAIDVHATALHLCAQGEGGLQASASRRARGGSRRQGTPRAAPGSGQPRPIGPRGATGRATRIGVAWGVWHKGVWRGRGARVGEGMWQHGGPLCSTWRGHVREGEPEGVVWIMLRKEQR